RKAVGNLRYDVVRSVKPPQSHTTFLAAWRNRNAFDAYENSAYARQFRDTVGPLLGSPFDDRLYIPINCRLTCLEAVACDPFRTSSQGVRPASCPPFTRRGERCALLRAFS